MWLLGDDLGTLRMNELLKEIQKLGMEPKPGSLWTDTRLRRKKMGCSVEGQGVAGRSFSW